MTEGGLPVLRTYIVKPAKKLGIPNWVEEVEAKDRQEAETLGARLLKDYLKTNAPVDFFRVNIRATVKEKINRWETHPPEQMDLSHIPKEDLEWLVGFWEGDGTITSGGGSFAISFLQKDPSVLYIIKDLLKLPTEPLKMPSGGWHLYLGGKAASLPLAESLCNTLVSPQRVEQLNKILTGLSIKLRAEEHLPTNPWIAGFWDADGHSTTDGHTITLAFTQKDREVLDKIRNLIGMGTFHTYRNAWMLYWNGPSSKPLASTLKKYSKDPRKKRKLLTELGCLAMVNPTYKEYYDEL